MNAELLRRSADGDEDAFMRFYDSTSPVAYQWALRRVRGDRHRAEETTRALYRTAWERASRHAASGLDPLVWLLAHGHARTSHD